MRLVPLLLAGTLGMLAFLGAWVRAYDVDIQAHCTYGMAELPAPAADVLFIGASRVGVGVDPLYIERLLADAGRPLRVERIAMGRPQAAQFRPILMRYLAHRGAPRLVFLQLIYNFREIHQDTIDLPPNFLRNQAFATIPEMAAVQIGVPLNDTGSRLSRRLHAAYASFPAVLLNKFEYNVFSALRYLPKRIRGIYPPCTGDLMQLNGSDFYVYDEVTGSESFAPLDPARAAARTATAAAFLPPAPAAAWRAFETAQMKALVALMRAAGSEVVLIDMPAFNQRDIDPATRAEIAAVFPGVDLLFPRAGLDPAVARQLLTSYTDTHHVNLFGALHHSRVFAAEIVRRLGP